MVIRMSPQLTAGLKQFARIALVSAIPIILQSIQSEVPIKQTLLAIFVSVLMGVDKYVHENPRMALEGIVPF